MMFKTKLKMVLLWIVMVTAYLHTGARPAHAGDAGACYGVQDADARTYCLARARGEPARCYSIQSADMRSQCLAEVRQ